MLTNAENLKLIKQITLDVFSGSKVLLFGSRAKNIEHSDSDYDILIIVKTAMEVKLKMHFKSLLRKRFVESDIKTDIFIESETEIKIKSQLPGHIIKTAFAEGVYL